MVFKKTKENKMIKTKETSKGKIKIIISGVEVKSLYKLLDSMSLSEIEKYTELEESRDVCNIWYAIEQVYSPQCE